MTRKTGLMLLAIPIAMGLAGCAPTGNGADAQANGALLGQAATAALALLGQGQGGAQAAPAPQAIDGSLTGGLPGSLLGQSSSGAPGPFDPQPLTLGSGVASGAGGSAAENAFTLASTAAIRDQEPANDGRLTLTQYGSKTDKYLDGRTAKREGNRSNTLRASSLALAPNLIRQYGLRGGEAIYVKTSRGNFYLGTYDDTTGNERENNVIDVYDPGDRLGNNNFLASIPPGGWQLAVGPRTA